MQVQVRHNPSFTVGRCLLAGGEKVRVEGGAMMAHSPGIEVDAKMEGGFAAGLKRKLLAGESFFVTTYTAPPQGGWVDIAGVLPGDLLPIDITPDRPFYIARGNWIANATTVSIDTKFGGMQSLFGGEGGFGLQASGQGQVVVSVYGAMDVVSLAPGDQIVVDTGHVVAYDLSVQFRMRRVASGALTSMKSGEGWVFDFAGPGHLLLQTRNPDSFAQWAASAAPGNNPKGGLFG